MGREKGADGRTASILGVRSLASYLRTRGLDADALLAELAITPGSLEDVNLRIPEELRVRAWRRAAAIADDPAFGLHMATHMVPGTYDALDYALCASATLGDALGRIARYHRVLADALAITIVTSRGTTRLLRTGQWATPEESEFFFAFIALRAGQVTNDKGRPQKVCFAHRAPRNLAPYEALFHCPVSFGRPAPEMVFASGDMELAAAHRSPGLAKVLDRHLEDIVSRLPSEHTFGDRVRRAIASTLRGGTPTLEAVALALHASPRTVQRRLQEMGTTHRDIVDDVRRELARRYMEKPDVSVTDAAFLLGFSEPSGFRRAYKRWTGTSPKAHPKA